LKVNQRYAGFLSAMALAFSAIGSAQDIKIGYNGDLSASPSAQSGHAAVIGMEAAIADIKAAGGLLGRKLALVASF
jgi:branched-chain amino acid transport system substrate-binding protein